MISYYKVLIKETSEFEEEDVDGNINIKSQWFNEISKSFRTINEAKDFIRERYEGVKIEETEDNGMYIDVGNKTKRVGTVYRFKNKDYSHNDEWLQCDWVEVRKVSEDSVIL